MSLFTKTPPTTSGNFWWRADVEAYPIVCMVMIGPPGNLCGSAFDNGWSPMEQRGGEWGPRVHVPIAAPVECFGLMLADGTVSAEAANRPEAYKAALKVFPGSKVVRGVFIPLAVEEPPQ